MINRLLKRRDLSFERSYKASTSDVWRAWTDPEALREWWGPENTSIPECELDLKVGGRFHIVMEAGSGMGKYEGTRWPMIGTFSAVEENSRLVYDARSWTEGEEETSSIEHTNSLSLVEQPDGLTKVMLTISITKIGPEAKLAAFGMKWGYKQYLEKLEGHLVGDES